MHVSFNFIEFNNKWCHFKDPCSRAWDDLKSTTGAATKPLQGISWKAFILWWVSVLALAIAFDLLETWMTNTNYVSQALRVVRSLEEVKEELRGLTVRVDGQEETVVGLLESGRFFLIFLYLIWLFKIYHFRNSLYVEWIFADFSWPTILFSPHFHSYPEGSFMHRR